MTFFRTGYYYNPITYVFKKIRTLFTWLFTKSVAYSPIPVSVNVWNIYATVLEDVAEVRGSLNILFFSDKADGPIIQIVNKPAVLTSLFEIRDRLVKHLVILNDTPVPNELISMKKRTVAHILSLNEVIQQKIAGVVKETPGYPLKKEFAEKNSELKTALATLDLENTNSPVSTTLRQNNVKKPSFKDPDYDSATYLNAVFNEVCYSPTPSTPAGTSPQLPEVKKTLQQPAAVPPPPAITDSEMLQKTSKPNPDALAITSNSESSDFSKKNTKNEDVLDHPKIRESVHKFTKKVPEILNAEKNTKPTLTTASNFAREKREAGKYDYFSSMTSTRAGGGVVNPGPDAPKTQPAVRKPYTSGLEMPENQIAANLFRYSTQSMTKRGVNALPDKKPTLAILGPSPMPRTTPYIYETYDLDQL